LQGQASARNPPEAVCRFLFRPAVLSDFRRTNRT
jgi:hypothetical protein